jgi:cytoskeleton protein RodZ
MAPPASEASGFAAPLAAASPPPVAVAEAGALQLVADESTWVEVRARDGRVLLSRIVQPGERIGLDGPAPLRLVVGNVRATRVTYRDQAVDLGASARDNVARLELR